MIKKTHSSKVQITFRFKSIPFLAHDTEAGDIFIVCKNKAPTSSTSDDKEQFLSAIVEVITLATSQAGIFLSRETTDNKWLASCQFQEKDWRESRLDVPQWRLLKKSCEVRRRGRPTRSVSREKKLQEAKDRLWENQKGTTTKAGHKVFSGWDMATTSRRGHHGNVQLAHQRVDQSRPKLQDVFSQRILRLNFLDCPLLSKDGN